MIGWLFGDFFLICGWLACAVWLVGWLARWLDVSDKAERAACISIISWQLLETAGEAKDGSPCHLGKSLEKEKRLFQLTIGDGLHSYPSMDMPTICFCRMLVNWPMNIIIIIIFSSSSSSSLSCFWCPWLTFIWVSRCQGKFTGNCNTISALGQSRKKHPGILKLAQWRKKHPRIRPWRVGLFDFGSGFTKKFGFQVRVRVQSVFSAAEGDAHKALLVNKYSSSQVHPGSSRSIKALPRLWETTCKPSDMVKEGQPKPWDGGGSRGGQVQLRVAEEHGLNQKVLL